MREVAPVAVVPRKRRGAELALIVFALGLTLGAYAVVDLNVTGQISSSFPYVAGICIGVAALTHIAVRWRVPYADPVILPCVILLNGLGLVMIHRIDLINDPPLNGARQQLIWTAVGIALFILVVVWLNDHRPLQAFTYTIGLAGIVLLLLPMVPGLGTEKFGAQIWIQVGPYSFQPAEAAKILLAIAFASYLVEKRDVLALAGYRVLGIDLPRARDLGPILVMWLISLAILVWQRDLGTSLLFFGLFVMMLYVSTERAGWVVLGTLLFAAGAYFGPRPGRSAA
jgi:cell division protein FtsW (lipid II flippase)